MKCTTARPLRKTEALLGRKLYPKEQSRILLRRRKGHEVVSAKADAAGGRPGVTLVWSDGHGQFLSRARTYGAISGEPRPACKRQLALVPIPVPATPVARPRERREHRSSAPTRGDPDDDPHESAAAVRECACGCGENIEHRAPQARYLNDQHSAADRQRKKRAAERQRRGDYDNYRRTCRCETPLLSEGICIHCGRGRTIGQAPPTDGHDPMVLEIMRDEARRGVRTVKVEAVVL